MIANVLSTIIGVPITWFFLVLLEIIITCGGKPYELSTSKNMLLSVIVQSPWLFPYEDEFYWMVPTATLILLVPCFFVSWFTEYLVSKKILENGNINNETIKKAVLLSNLVSYSLISIVPLVKLLIDLRK